VCLSVSNPSPPRPVAPQELFASDPDLEVAVRSQTSQGQMWSGPVRVSASPLLRSWMELAPGEERWHEVQVGAGWSCGLRTHTHIHSQADGGWLAGHVGARDGSGPRLLPGRSLKQAFSGGATV
jgi:hypothetical protein